MGAISKATCGPCVAHLWNICWEVKCNIIYYYANVGVYLTFRATCLLIHFFQDKAYLPTIPDSPELLRKSASNYGITAGGKIITDILDYGNLVTSGNNR